MFQRIDRRYEAMREQGDIEKERSKVDKQAGRQAGRQIDRQVNIIILIQDGTCLVGQAVSFVSPICQ